MSAREQRLYFLLQRTAHRLQKVADRRLLAAAGITTAQTAFLTILAGAPGATQRDIARQLGINESAMTALAGRLEAMNLITRGRSIDDPRAWRLALTAAGKDATGRATEAFESVNTMLDRALADGGGAALAEGLQAIWHASADD